MVSCMYFTNEIQKTVSRLIRIYSSGTRLPTPMSQTHSLNLQSGETGSLYVPFPRTYPYCGVFTRSVPRLWNSLRQAVRNSASENAFKKFALDLGVIPITRNNVCSVRIIVPLLHQCIIIETLKST